VFLLNDKNFTKKDRQDMLVQKIRKEPFLSDEELASFLSVSIPTIRLDRMELAIPELRERIKHMAEDKTRSVRTLSSSEIIGEIIDFNLGNSAISILETDDSMTFEKTDIVRGHYIYSLAESLSISTIDAHAAIVGIANVKYKIPIRSGQRLIAKAQVRKNEGNRYIVWVKIYIKESEVFRGKFVLISID
jgi:acyl-coenzyme A thioesterase PaaI-like protein